MDRTNLGVRLHEKWKMLELLDEGKPTGLFAHVEDIDDGDGFQIFIHSIDAPGDRPFLGGENCEISQIADAAARESLFKRYELEGGKNRLQRYFKPDGTPHCLSSVRIIPPRRGCKLRLWMVDITTPDEKMDDFEERSLMEIREAMSGDFLADPHDSNLWNTAIAEATAEVAVKSHFYKPGVIEELRDCIIR